jgi:hypothetical protein
MFNSSNDIPSTTGARVPWEADSRIATDLPPHKRDLAWLLQFVSARFGGNAEAIRRLHSLSRFLHPTTFEENQMTPEEQTWQATLPPGWKARVCGRTGQVLYTRSGTIDSNPIQIQSNRPSSDPEARHFNVDLIGFIGNKGVGKDTAAQYLIHNHGWEKLAFADPLRSAVQSMFALTDEECNEPNMKEIPGALGVSFRRGAQVVGTDFARNQLPTLLPELGPKGLWIRHLERGVANAVCRGKRVVVTDVRFVDEAEAILKMGGKLVHIIRPSINGQSDGHESEQCIQQICDRFHPTKLVNDGTPEQLAQHLETIRNYFEEQALMESGVDMGVSGGFTIGS